jgi:putative DNA primase/helicase
MIKYAIAYAKRGFPVVRTHSLTSIGNCSCGAKGCTSPGKHPQGSPKPTTDRVNIRQWPADGYSIGIYPDDSFFVLDIDAKDKGLTTLATWEVDHGRLPATPTVRTGGGGFHFYFKAPENLVLKNKVKVAQGVDIRAKGGFVVAPPSMHKSGTPYSWDMDRGAPSIPLANAPAWLLAILTKEKKAPTIFDGDSPFADIDVEATPIEKRLKAAKRALADHPEAVEGDGGDLTTLQAASIGYDFGVPLEKWSTPLSTYNDERCDPPWSPEALTEKLRSAYTNNSADKPFGWKLRPMRRDPLARPALKTTSERGLADAWLKERGLVRIVSGYVYVYIPELGIWQRWDEAKCTADVYTLHGRDVLTDDGKTTVVNMTSARSKAIYHAIRHTAHLIDDDFFLVRKTGVMIKSGFLTLNANGEVLMLEKSPEHRVRNAIPVDYDSEADYDSLVDLLRHTFEGDTDAEEKILALQEFYGIALIGMATHYAKALMMVGNGANGKSTIMELLEDALFPKGTSCASPPQKWHKHEYVFELVDKLLNSVSEVPDQRILASDTLKQVISGEALSARPVYGQLMRFLPYAAHVFSANDLPEVSDHSHGFWRRFLVVTFNRNFSNDPDRKTKEQIKAAFVDAAPAILKWVLEGAARVIMTRGYTEPASHLETLIDWKRETNDVAIVASKCFAKTAEIETPSAELYATYREVCEAEGMKPMGHVVFGKKMTALFGKARKSNGKMVYRCAIRNEKEWDIATVNEGFKERRTYTAAELKAN